MVDGKQALFSLEDHLRPRIALWAHIAIGVCLGIIGAVAIMGCIGALTLSVWTAAVADAMKRSAEQMQQTKAAATRAASKADAERRQLLAETQRAEEAEKSRKIAEDERRDLAWARYYRKASTCDETRGGAWSVDCANDYMRAKARFAELYDAGKL